MIGSEDNAGLIGSTGNIIKQSNLLGLSAAEVVSLTAVAVSNVDRVAVDLLHKLLAQLVSEKDTGSNNNNGLRTVSEQTQRVTDHDHGLATACGDKHLTRSSTAHRIESTLLVGAESDGQVGFASMHIV